METVYVINLCFHTVINFTSCIIYNRIICYCIVVRLTKDMICFAQVINWQETLLIPTEAKMSSSARDLILKLLRSPSDRLGQQGASEIKDHRFFAKLNFKDFRQQNAPYRPQIRYPTDTSNFDPVDPEKLRHNSNDDTLKKDGTLENGKHPEHAFLEFTFRRFFDDGGHVYAPKHIDMDESNSPVYV